MTTNLSQVNTTAGSGETWGTTLDKVNQAINALNQVVVTANTNANGSVTIGNAYVVGIFTGTTMTAETALRGGNVQSAANLAVTSNVSVGNSTANVFLGFGQVNVSGVLSVNSTVLGFGSNIVINTSFVTVGNSTVNTQANSSVVSTGTGNFSTGANVGANVNLTTSGFQIGNSTVNTQANSSLITADVVNQRTGANVGANVNLTTSGLQIGNSTVNTQANSSVVSTSTGNFSTGANVGANVNLTTSGYQIGNSTVNTQANSSLVTADVVNHRTGANVGANVNLTTSGYQIGNSTINVQANSTTLLLTGNLSVNATNFQVGNSTVNAQINSSLITVDTVNARIGANVGANVNLTTSGLQVGNSTVNAQVNSSVVITDTINARTGSNVGANVNLTTSGLQIGNSTVNTQANSSLITADVVNHRTGANVGANVNLTTSGLQIGNSTVNTQANSSLITADVVNHRTGANVGANVNLTTSGLQIGNSTVNTQANSSVINTGTIGVSIGNFSTSINVGANVQFTTAGAFYGNSSINNIVNSVGLLISANMTVNSTTLKVGNSSVNALINSSFIGLNGVAVPSADTRDSVALNNVLVGTRSRVNFKEGAGISLGVTDDATGGQINVVVTATGTGQINATDVLVSNTLTVGNSTVNTFANSTLVNTATFTATTLMQVGANVYMNTTAFQAGNSTVNTQINSSVLVTDTVNHRVGSNVGANVNLTTTGYQIGNTTINVQANSSTLVFGGGSLINTTSVSTATGNFSTGANVGANVNLTTSGFQIGNTTVNTQANSSVLSTSTGNFLTGANVGANVNLTTSGFQIGNSTVNTQANSSVVTAGTINARTGANVGANVLLNTTAIFIGNSTFSLFGNSILFTVSNTTASLNINTSGVYVPTIGAVYSKFLYGNATGAGELYLGGSGAGDPSEHIIIRTRGTDRAKWDSNGYYTNWGQFAPGGVAPDQGTVLNSQITDLVVQSTDTVYSRGLVSWNVATGAFITYAATANTLTPFGHGLVGVNRTILSEEFGASNGSAWSMSAKATVTMDGTANGTSMPGKFDWYTMPAGSTGTAPTLRMTLNAAGILGVANSISTNSISLNGGTLVNSTVVAISTMVMNSTVITVGGGSTINSTVWTGLAWTANNTTYVNGKTEGNLNVNSAATITGSTSGFNVNSALWANQSFVQTTNNNSNNIATTQTVDRKLYGARSASAITGGGTISYGLVSGYVKWDARLIVISDNKGTEHPSQSTDAYIDITCPITGSIDVVGTTAVTATADGIPLAAWQSLYYDASQGTGIGAPAFHIISYNTGTSNFAIPASWVLICHQNDDGGYVRFTNGVTLKSGQSISFATYSSANWPLANNASYLGGLAAANYANTSDPRFTGTIGVGTGSGNVVVNTSTILVTNSTGGTSQVNSSAIQIGIANLASQVNVGANVWISTTDLQIGNSTVNAQINSSLMTIDTVNHRAGCNVGANVTINTSALRIGNSTVYVNINSTTSFADSTARVCVHSALGGL